MDQTLGPPSRSLSGISVLNSPYTVTSSHRHQTCFPIIRGNLTPAPVSFHIPRVLYHYDLCFATPNHFKKNTKQTAELSVFCQNIRCAMGHTMSSEIMVLSRKITKSSRRLMGSLELKISPPTSSRKSTCVMEITATIKHVMGCA